MVDALSETAIGRALLAFWEDMPLWILADVTLAASLVPSVAAWLLGSAPLTIILSFPASFVIAGMASAMAQPIRESKPSWRDLLKGHYAAALSIWVGLAAAAASFLLPLPAPVFAVQCMVAAAALMLAPFALCASASLPIGPWLAWRNAFVLAICYPMVSVGLLALAAILGWLVVAINVAFFLVVPALWVSIAMHSVHELTKAHCTL